MCLLFSSAFSPLQVSSFPPGHCGLWVSFKHNLLCLELFLVPKAHSSLPGTFHLQVSYLQQFVKIGSLSFVASEFSPSVLLSQIRKVFILLLFSLWFSLSFWGHWMERRREKFPCLIKSICSSIHMSSGNPGAVQCFTPPRKLTMWSDLVWSPSLICHSILLYIRAGIHLFREAWSICWSQMLISWI